MTSLIEDNYVRLMISTTYDDSKHSGGSLTENVEDILTRVNNTKYNFLLSVNNRYKFDNKYAFEYNTAENKKIYNMDDVLEQNKTISTYFGEGASTAVFSIRSKNRIFDSVEQNDNLIIKMFKTESVLHFMNFINDWYKNKRLYGDNITDIYLYGAIVDKNQNEISKYIITKKYNVLTNSETVRELSLINRIEIIKSMLDFCSRLQSESKVWSDLKTENVGYTIKDGKFIAVVIDYDSDTIVDKDKFKWMLSEYNYLAFIQIGRTYVPAYVDKLFYRNYVLNDENFEKISGTMTKISIIGAVDVINSLLLEGFSENVDSNLKLSKLIQYFSYTKFYADEKTRRKYNNIFLNEQNYNRLFDNNVSLTQTIFGSEYDAIRPYLIKIIKNMLKYKYNEIPSYEKILTDLTTLANLLIRPTINLSEQKEQIETIDTNDTIDTKIGEYNRKYLKYADKIKLLQNSL